MLPLCWSFAVVKDIVKINSDAYSRVCRLMDYKAVNAVIEGNVFRKLKSSLVIRTTRYVDALPVDYVTLVPRSVIRIRCTSMCRFWG